MSRINRVCWCASMVAALAAMAGAGRAQAATVSIPNSSFESPVIRVAPYATATIGDWQKAPAPAWWTQQGYSEQDWLNTAGVFYNVPGSAHIDNVDGEQAVFLFSTPGVELYQDLAATYEVGQSYQLTGAFQGGGQGMQIGVPLELRLCYRDGNGNRVTIGATEVLNVTDESQPHALHLDDWQLQIPSVLSAAPWAGKSIGIEIISTVPFQSAGGYWRLDNIRLTSIPETASAALLMAGLTLLGRRRGCSEAKT
jgi:HpiC1 cyclase